MSKSPPSTKAMVAFKIGARARKFALEGFPIEGYEYLYTAIHEAEQADPDLFALLQVELEKYEQRMPQEDDT